MLYHAITGVTPPNAVERMIDDRYEPIAHCAGPGFSPDLLAGIDAGLAVPVKNRPQSIDDWRKMFSHGTAGIQADAPTQIMVKPAPPPVGGGSGGEATPGQPETASYLGQCGYYCTSCPGRRRLRCFPGHATADSGRSGAKPHGEAKAKAEADAVAEKQVAESAETGLKLTTSDRQRLQVALTSLGFDTRGSDGAFGPRSREMIAAWQKARNQPATGFLNATQQQALLKEAAALVRVAR